MKILISNDDGVHAAGIRALANEIAMIAEVTVIAPETNRSGASNSLSLDRPLHIKRLDNGHYSVDGTPTDCVHLAVTGGVLETQFDMVISGINDGSNLGDDILYSGTVAAAMEGRFLGLPAIAFSLVGEKIKHYDTAAKIARDIIKRMQQNLVPSKTILNINIPDLPLDKLKGIQITRLGKRHCSEPTVKALDPRGKEIYWIGSRGIEEDAGPGTDFYAVSHGYVSVTPLQPDMTNYQAFDRLSHHLGDLKWES